MKYCFFIFFIFLANLNSALAAGTTSALSTVSDQNLYSDKRILENKEFKECQGKTYLEGYPSTTPNNPSEAQKNSLQYCIDGVVAKIKSDPKKLEQFLSDNDFNEKKLENIKVENSAAFNKLQDYLSKKLEKNLYGLTDDDLKKGKTDNKNVADHVVFIKLYKTQIAKSVLFTISNYCINADEYGCYSSASNVRENNLKLLESFDGGVDKNQNDASERYNVCLARMKEVCDKGGVTLSDGQGGTIFKDCSDTNAKNHACIATAQLRSLKEKTAETKKIEDEYQKHEKEGLSEKATGYSLYTGSQKGTQESIGQLTTLTSSEIINKSGYQDQINADQKKLEECKATPQKTGCDELLKTIDEKSMNKLSGEYYLRTKLEETQIGTTEKEVHDYLVRQGRSDEDASKIIKEEGLAAIQTKIRDTFNNERNAVISQLRASLDKTKTAAASDKATSTQFESAAKQIGAQAQQLKELSYYNNIVTSYLSITDGNTGKEIGKNTAGAVAEFKDSAYSSSGRNVASSSGNSVNINAAKEGAEKHGITSNKQKDDNNSSELGLSDDKTLNTLIDDFNYEQKTAIEGSKKKNE